LRQFLLVFFIERVSLPLNAHARPPSHQRTTRGLSDVLPAVIGNRNTCSGKRRRGKWSCVASVGGRERMNVGKPGGKPGGMLRRSGVARN